MTVECVLEVGDTVKDKSDSVRLLVLCRSWLLVPTGYGAAIAPVSIMHAYIVCWQRQLPWPRMLTAVQVKRCFQPTQRKERNRTNVMYGMNVTNLRHYRVPRLLGSHGFLSLKIPGPGKSWKITFVLESAGNYSLRPWKVLEKYPWKSCIFLVVQMENKQQQIAPSLSTFCFMLNFLQWSTLWIL